MKAFMAGTAAGAIAVGSGAAIAAGQRSGTASGKNYACIAGSPCSGSKTRPIGWYAFCGERPDNSGQYVGIKGCASEAPAVSGDGKASASAHIIPVIQRELLDVLWPGSLRPASLVVVHPGR